MADGKADAIDAYEPAQSTADVSAELSSGRVDTAGAFIGQKVAADVTDMTSVAESDMDVDDADAGDESATAAGNTIIAPESAEAAEDTAVDSSDDDSDGADTGQPAVRPRLSPEKRRARRLWKLQLHRRHSEL